MASNHRYKFDKMNRLTTVMEGRIMNIVINTYLKMKIPMGKKKFFQNIANNGEFINNFCISPNNKFHCFYNEWYL